MFAQAPSPGPAPLALKATVVRSYPHDRSAFTQGLVWRDGVLYESTGLVGRSSLRKVELATGTVTKQVDVPTPYFAEGLADVGNRLLQLTWQHGRVFVYDRNTLRSRRRVPVPGRRVGAVPRRPLSGDEQRQ